MGFLNCPSLTPFILNFTGGRGIFGGKKFCTVRFTAKANHFVAFKFDFKESRGTFALGCEWGDKPVMLVSFKFFTEFGFDQILHIFCSNPEIVASFQ